MKGLDTFFDEANEAKAKDDKRKAGFTKPELIDKVVEQRAVIEDDWGQVELLDFEKLETDKDGVPYIVVRVDEDFISWLNDMTGMTGIPFEQSITESLAFYHSFLSYTIFKITGDPLYIRKKKQFGSDAKKVKEILSREVRAVEARLTAIKEAIENIEKEEVVDDDEQLGLVETDDEEEHPQIEDAETEEEESGQS